MQDLKRIFEKLKSLYPESGAAIPVLKKFSLGPKWAMAEDDEHISLALRIGKELSPEEYEAKLRPFYGLPVDQAISALLENQSGNLTDEKENPFREPAVALLNLMSKPLNTKGFLSSRGIRKESGLKYPFENKGKKTGLIGFGGYAKYLFPEAEEFHVYDLRTPEQIEKGAQGELYRRLKDRTVWHLGKDAREELASMADLDILIMSGSGIVNDSYMDVLNACRNAAVVGLYGPSNELCPEYLFEQGFDYLFSADVRDKEEYKAVSTSGRPYTEFDYMDTYTLFR